MRVEKYLLAAVMSAVKQLKNIEAGAALQDFKIAMLGIAEIIY